MIILYNSVKRLQFRVIDTKQPKCNKQLFTYAVNTSKSVKHLHSYTIVYDLIGIWMHNNNMVFGIL